MKKKKWLWLILLLVAGIFLYPRQDPKLFLNRYMNDLEVKSQLSPVRYPKIETLKEYAHYAIARVTFDMRNDVNPPEHMFIFDRKKDFQRSDTLSQWTGYVILVKKGWYSWEVVK